VSAERLALAALVGGRVEEFLLCSVQEKLLALLPLPARHIAAVVLTTHITVPPTCCTHSPPALQRGTTGYPLVDAGMRELWQTGYCCNYVRHIVAGFLVGGWMGECGGGAPAQHVPARSSAELAALLDGACLSSAATVPSVYACWPPF
jgi:hypothetical protein